MPCTFERAVMERHAQVRGHSVGLVTQVAIEVERDLERCDSLSPPFAHLGVSIELGTRQFISRQTSTVACIGTASLRKASRHAEAQKGSL
jgi:hypothetical protein